MDRGAWQAAVHSVTKSRTRLSAHTHTMDPSQMTPLLQFHTLETLAGYIELSINCLGKKGGVVVLLITKRSPPFDT